jgi:hypothetical protein
MKYFLGFLLIFLYNIIMKKKFNEISLNRILNHFQDESNLAIISIYRTERSEKENRQLLQELKQKIRQLGYGFTELLSRLTETNEETCEILNLDERFLMIYGTSLDDAINIGKEFQQPSIIYKNATKCVEVCTIDFIDYGGNEYKCGNIIHVFNISNKTPLNIQDVKDIFEKRKGGSASMLVKSNRAFKLSEVLEVESHKASTFNEKERFFKII